MDNRHFGGPRPLPGCRPSFGDLEFSAAEINELLKRLVKMQDVEGLVSGVNIVNIENHELLQPGNLTLEDLGAARLENMNDVFVPWQGSAYATRNYLPALLRRKGISISYVTDKGIAVKERAVSDVGIDNANWGIDSNWMRVDELSLNGKLYVSPNGTWVINGVDTGIQALGPKGDNGLTPRLKTIDNKLHYSYDGNTWLDAGGEHIAAWFRWSGNKIQISRDNKTWEDFSGEFADNLFIKGYVATFDQLPADAVQGDIWGVGPRYAAEDTEQTQPIYRYWVRNAGGWVDNGEFTSIAAGIVQETGDGEGVVMSQKAVSEKLSQYTFIYPFGRIPKITNIGTLNEPIYSVVIVQGDYYIMNNNNFSIETVTIEQEMTLEVAPGKALVFDVSTKRFEAYGHTQQNVNGIHIVLLNNMRLAQGQFEPILLNSVIKEQHHIINDIILPQEQIILFGMGRVPKITHNNDNSYTVVFQKAIIYRKELRTNVVRSIETFVDKEESERTFVVNAGQALYYFNGEFIVDSINNATINGTSPFILLLENSRYAEAGQLLSVLLNSLILDFDSFKNTIPNNVESYDYTTFANITNYQDDMFEYVRPIRTLNFYVDDENMSDTFGLGVLKINNGYGRFYIYDVDKGYNICVIDIMIPDGQETLTGTTRLFGNYTVKDRINVFIDGVINWDLFTKSTSTASPTILFKPTASISSEEFKSKFTSDLRLKGHYDEFFTVEVNGQNQNEAIYDGVDNSYSLSSATYNDMCHFVMPSESKDEPIKLIILCHGGGVTVTETVDNWYNYQNIGKIFNALGYAVLLTNGMPRDWANEHGIGIDRQVGNWMAVQSVVKAYNYVMEKYNLDRNGCYVYGQSQGGMVAENVAELSGLPILATVLESPAISMQYAQLYIPTAKSYLQALYGFNSQDTYNENKCIGLDPYIRNVSPKIEISGNSVVSLDIDLNTMTSKKYRINTPVMIIRSLDDTTISPKVIGAYAQAIINAGGNCKLLTYTSAGHSTIAGTEIIGTLNGLSIRSGLYNILCYLHQFGGYGLNNIVIS